MGEIWFLGFTVISISANMHILQYFSMAKHFTIVKVGLFGGTTFKTINCYGNMATVVATDLL